jgi:hypothetical protein
MDALCKDITKKASANIIGAIFEFLEMDEKLTFSKLSKRFHSFWLSFLENVKHLEIIGENEKLLYFFMNFSVIKSVRELKIDNLSWSVCNNEKYDKKFQKFDKLKFLTISNLRIHSNESFGRFIKIMSSKSLISLCLKSMPFVWNGFAPFINNFYNLPLLRDLSLTHCNLKDDGYTNYEAFKTSNKLMNINLCGNNLMDFILFICKNISTFKNLLTLNFMENNLGGNASRMISDYLSSVETSLISLDLSNNFIYKEDLNYISNKLLKIENLVLSGNYEYDEFQNFVYENDDMFVNEAFMLFSTSGVVKFDSNSSQDIIGKNMCQKKNGAILPLYIYSSEPKIKFTKEELIKILQSEDKIRLSERAKKIYELVGKSVPSLIEHDRQMIEEALTENGYSPLKDDSLKAYHIATAKYINDLDIKNQVVWMKYDKSKKGNFSLNDHINVPTIHNVYLHKLTSERVQLTSLLSTTKPNFIVSGSLS